MPFDKDAVRRALGTVGYPAATGGAGGAGGGSGGGSDLVAAGAVRKVAVCDGHVSVTLAGGGVAPAHRAEMSRAAETAIRSEAERSGERLAEVHVEVTDAGAVAGAGPGAAAGRGGGGGGGGAGEAVRERTPDSPPQARAESLPGVKHIIAVGAGKGGVGKSTIAVNLAVGLARSGHAVGLMDGDIYGPSLPTMLGLGSAEVIVRERMIEPFFVHGVKANTIGKLVDADKPLIWRGPMAHGAFKQLVEQTRWGELDYLIVDLPPGTGDVALTMAQIMKLTGAVVVCTPQRVAQDDAVRATRMFQQLGIEVLGVVENMSYFVADDIEPPRVYDIFGRGGAEKMAQRLGVPFLGAVPITTALRENSDRGDPVSNFDAGPLRDALEGVVRQVESQAALASLRLGKSRPKLSIH